MKKIVLFLSFLIAIAVCYGAGFNTNAPSANTINWTYSTNSPSSQTYPVSFGKYSLTMNSNNWNTFTDNTRPGFFGLSYYSNNIGYTPSGYIDSNITNKVFLSPGTVGVTFSFSYSNSMPNYSAYLKYWDSSSQIHFGTTNTLLTNGAWTNAVFWAFDTQSIPSNLFELKLMTNNTSTGSESLSFSNVQAGYFFPGTFATNSPSTNTIP